VRSDLEALRAAAATELKFRDPLNETSPASSLAAYFRTRHVLDQLGWASLIGAASL
jgi:hypothetical protein